MEQLPYSPRHLPEDQWIALRHQNIHGLRWDSGDGHQAPWLVLLHGWMDVAASFQFVVDALLDLGPRRILALDWRGFGQTVSPATDSYWFPDYLGDLDGVLRHISPDEPVDLLGHSMGGNVAMSYAGVRPRRIRRMVNLEGFGLPGLPAHQSPARLAQWLDELATPARLSSYDSLEAVAQRLQKNNPRLPPNKALWLAQYWAELRPDGRWHVRADPAHKRLNPVGYRVDEVLAQWAQISAPTLVVEASETDVFNYWPGRYSLAEFHDRLNVVPNIRVESLPDCAHMLHHDQPEAVARLVHDFLQA